MAGAISGGVPTAKRARPVIRFGECCRRPPRIEIGGGLDARLEPDDDRDVMPVRAPPPIAADRTSSAVDCESKKRWYGARVGGVDTAIVVDVPEHATGGRTHEMAVSCAPM